MSRNTSIIDVTYTDAHINTLLELKKPTPEGLTDTGQVRCLYNQNEDQFLLLDETITIPSFPVHHSIDNPVPPPGYTDRVYQVCENIMRVHPELIAGTQWFFNPISILAPSFYRVVTHEDQYYLYVCMVDLNARALEIEITEQGSNDRTHAYRTNRLYFECDWFPLAEIQDTKLVVEQTIPLTWKGEAGQGYMIHGIWMDSDINKFFSKLILPAGKRNHPYYPLTCKNRCVSMNAIGIKHPDILHRIRRFIEPQLDTILEDLQSTPFSELAPLFIEQKKQIPPDLGGRWKGLKVQAYLNDKDQKEYTVEF